MEPNKILIRFGELSLKGKNKMNFVRQLAKNVSKICGINHDQITLTIDRLFLPYSEHILKQLEYVFGISSYSPVYKIESNIESIENFVKDGIKHIKFNDFKVSSRRNWKEFPMGSQELNFHIGGLVLKNFKTKVNVHNPDLEISIEIRKDFTYIYYEKIQGLGGLPVGVSGKVVHLMSGGIDSPVAAFELMKRGVKVDFLSFVTPPHTDQNTIDKVRDLVTHLTKYQIESKLMSFHYTDIMNYIGLTSNQAYKIILMRRSFYRIASKLASQSRSLGISNGENLGQVASQTMEAMSVIHNQSALPIYQPLLTNDKNDTIKLGEKIGTYNLSISKCLEACELFAPEKPATKPNLKDAELLERELDKLFELENKSIENNITFSYIKYYKK